MHKLSITAMAILLGTAWTVGPAVAADTAADKVDRATDKAERKIDRAADKTEDKAGDLKDKAESKSESTMDKVKTKARNAKDKVSDKLHDMSTQPREDVKAAQQALRASGHDPGPIDGAMGPRTEAAVRAYQKTNGLEVTGRLDDATMDKLAVRSAGSALPGPTPAPAAVGGKQAQ